MTKIERDKIIGMHNCARVLSFLAEQGFATASQLARAVWGPYVQLRNNGHRRLIRLLMRDGLIRWFRPALIGIRLYYATEEAVMWAAEQGLDCWEMIPPPIDYHAGRSPKAIAHSLGLNELRLSANLGGFKWTSERIISATLGGPQKGRRIPDALIWREDDNPKLKAYWSGPTPLCIEYERTPKRHEDRREVIWQTVQSWSKLFSGICIVGRPPILEAYQNTIDDLRANPKWADKDSYLGQKNLHESWLSYFAFHEETSLEIFPTKLAQAKVALSTDASEGGVQPTLVYSDYWYRTFGRVLDYLPLHPNCRIIGSLE